VERTVYDYDNNGFEAGIGRYPVNPNHMVELGMWRMRQKGYFACNPMNL
jgi:hypothetical protein